MAVYSLYLPGDRLTLAELSAARLDGEVFALGAAFVAADAEETTVLRAASMVGLLSESLAATHRSAAWILGALAEPPGRPSLQRAVTRRLHRYPLAHVRYRDGALPTHDLSRLGGILVTTPARTLADLARSDDPADTEAAELLAQSDPAAVADAIAWFDGRRPVPGKRRALDALHRWRDQPDVTR